MILTNNCLVEYEYEYECTNTNIYLLNTNNKKKICKQNIFYFLYLILSLLHFYENRICVYICLSVYFKDFIKNDANKQKKKKILEMVQANANFFCLVDCLFLYLA